MAIKIYKPNDAGRRNGMSIVDRSVLSNKAPEKRLLAPLKKNAGRNNTGAITCRHRGGGEKRMYRLVDFNQTAKKNIPGRVEALEYDPNRTTWLALVTYVDGDKRYHLAAHTQAVGDEVMTADRTKVKPGNRCQLQHVPAGFTIFNLELTPGKGGQMVRNVKLGKAGRSRRMGRRPEVRGKVMNPCDHPHGGGEARNSIGMTAPKTPWGALALGVKTRKPNKYSDTRILRKRKPGRFSTRSKG